MKLENITIKDVIITDRVVLGHLKVLIEAQLKYDDERITRITQTMTKKIMR